MWKEIGDAIGDIPLGTFSNRRHTFFSSVGFLVPATTSAKVAALLAVGRKVMVETS